MKKFLLIFIVFSICIFAHAQEETPSPTLKDQLSTGLDQLEDLMLGMEKSIIGLQVDIGVSQQAVMDMHSIAYAQGQYMNRLRDQVEELDRLDRAKSQYIVLLQSRQQKYKFALAVGIPAGVLVGVGGGFLLSRLIR